MICYRQPQWHCKNAVKKQVLVNTSFGFTKTCFISVLLGPPKTYRPKHDFYWYKTNI